MIFNINIEIDLSEDEIVFLRKYYLEDRKRVVNSIILLSSPFDEKIWEPVSNKNKNDHSLIKNLVSKQILKEDSIHNCTLTDTGLKVIDILDRDKKLTEILK